MDEKSDKNQEYNVTEKYEAEFEKLRNEMNEIDNPFEKNDVKAIFKMFGVIFKTLKLQFAFMFDINKNEVKVNKKFLLFYCIIAIAIVYLSNIVLMDFEFMQKINATLKAYVLIMLSFTITNLLYALLTYIYVSIKNNKYVNKIEKINGPENIYLYYRDYIKEYSVGTLSLCINPETKGDYNDEIMSTLLSLEYSNKIEFTDTNAKILDHNLSEIEKLAIEVVNENNSEVNVNQRWYELAMQEAINCGLIEKREKYITKAAVALYFVFWIINFGLILFYNNSLKGAVFAILFSSHFIGAVSIYAIAMIGSEPVVYRTKVGMEIANKLTALKNYMKDFSKINERSIKELKLWDYYLIFAIMFDLEGNLDKDAHKLLKKLRRN